jgi:GMP reductase
MYCPGDVAKAFGGGADFVMLGGMLAGHDEGKGKMVKKMDQNLLNFMDLVQIQQMQNIMVVFQIIEVVKEKQ